MDKPNDPEIVVQKFKLTNNNHKTAFRLDVPKKGLKLGEEFKLQKFFDTNGKCVKLVFTKVQ